MAKKKFLKMWWLIIVVVIIAAILVGVFVFNKKDNNSQTANSNSASTSTGSTVILPQTTFVNGLGSWYEEVWYQPKSSGGEVTTGPNGVTFKAIQANSRSGIMFNINKDVSDFSNVIIKVKGTANLQTLSGTGLNGREAPVAVAIAYKDAKGVDHNLLGEDPTATGQMFWRGFYYMAPSGGTGIVNGVKVTQNEPFSYSFDLMTLNPKPKTIEFVSLEGAGWISREGSISSLSITAD